MTSEEDTGFLEEQLATITQLIIEKAVAASARRPQRQAGWRRWPRRGKLESTEGERTAQDRQQALAMVICLPVSTKQNHFKEGWC